MSSQPPFPPSFNYCISQMHATFYSNRGGTLLLSCRVPQQEVVGRNPGVVKKPCLTLQRPDSQHQLTLPTLTHRHTHSHSAVVLYRGSVKVIFSDTNKPLTRRRLIHDPCQWRPSTCHTVIRSRELKILTSPL